MADVFGVPVTASKVFEASSRGAAILALNNLGILEDFSKAPTYLGKTYTPDGARHKIYEKARTRHEALYKMMVGFE